MKNKTKILLDTDIGSDIDDAVALSYLLKKPNSELKGITTVSGEPQKRAMIADAICKISGYTNIPIHSGSEVPLLCKQKQPRAQQATVLKNWNHRENFEAHTAVEFLHKTIINNPGELTLLAIGPLTNIALLFRTYPETVELLKSIVLMVGSFFTNPFKALFPEWNSYLDPHAAAIVFDSIKDIPNLSVGLDVTTKCTMSVEEVRKLFKGGVLDLVSEAAEVWFEQNKLLTFHDPLAAVGIFNPDIMEYKKGKIDIELKSDKLSGITLWDEEAEDKSYKIATSVNSDRFFEEYFSVVKG